MRGAEVSSFGRRRWRIGVGLALLLAAAGCATTPTPEPDRPLDVRIDALVDASPYDGIHWGILVVDADDATVVYQRNPDRRFTPASNLKIPVSVAALDLLGPEFRWSTEVTASAPLEAGTVPGDLRLHGSGDPTMGAPYADAPGEVLGALADSVRAAGVREVTGGVLLDATPWDSTSVPDSWMVGGLTQPYAATGGVFAVGRGELEVRVRGAGRAGEPAELQWRPRGRAPVLEGDVRTVSTDAEGPEIGYRPDLGRWWVSGSVGVGEERTLNVAARDPVGLGLDAFALALEDGGVDVNGTSHIEWPSRDQPRTAEADGAPDIDTAAAAERPARPIALAGRVSPPLEEVVVEILGASQNWMTEQLVRTIGMERGGTGSWEAGLGAIEQFLEKEVGVDSLDFHFRDGSGLSAYNLATPRGLVRTLAYADEAFGDPAFRSLLPAPGLEDTTLENRLRGMEGSVFAKTGTISHVNALSGYLVTDDGRELVFSVLTNASNLPADRVRDRIDAVVRELASPGR